MRIEVERIKSLGNSLRRRKEADIRWQEKGN